MCENGWEDVGHGVLGPHRGHISCAVFKAFSLKTVQPEGLSPGDEVVFSISHVSRVGSGFERK